MAAARELTGEVARSNSSMATGSRRRRWGIVYVAAIAGAMATASGGSDDWDPRAVQVHPRHDDFVGRPEIVPSLIDDGKALFFAKFTEADGAGRPAATGDSKPTPRSPSNGVAFSRVSGPDAMACSSCHTQPVTGGSGDFAANVFVGAHFADPPSTQVGSRLTNERNTTSILGAGLIELLAREMTEELWGERARAIELAAQRRAPTPATLTAKGISFGSIAALPDGTLDMTGLRGVDFDLVVRPFGVKGIAASLREFSIAALNQHHGMQAIERFGWERTGLRDFDGDGVEVEISVGQLTALVVFQAQLAPPRQVFDANPAIAAVERRGAQLFEAISCSACHVPSLPLHDSVFREPSPYNRPGAITSKDVAGTVDVTLGAHGGGPYEVRAFSDLKRHNLCDRDVHHYCNEERKQDNVPTELFLTAKLWDAATSSPYGHRGDLRTLSQAILNHGGEARPQREAFLRLPDDDKRAVIAFLRTLGRP